MLHEAAIIEQFRQAMAEHGIVVTAEIIADGKFHRVHVEGDRKLQRNGFYVLHLDGKPAGAFGCCKRYGHQAKFMWTAKGIKPLTPEERREFKARMERQRAERVAQEREARAAAAQHANFMWNQAAECSEHPYLTRKGVKSHGLRVGKWEKLDHENGEVRVISEQALLVPIRDAKKTIHSLQAIFVGKAIGDRDKDFVSGGAKEGLFYSFGRPLTVDVQGQQRQVICIGEGYATMASVHDCTGHACIVAFDAGNLLPVARTIRSKFPLAVLVLCSDNDQWTKTPIDNPGLTFARKAAAEVDGLVAFPPFAHTDGKPGKDGKWAGPTDFNDWHQAKGADAVREIIEAALNPPAPAQQVDDMPPWEGEQEPPAELAAPLPPPVDDGDDDRPENNGYFSILGYNRGVYYLFQHRQRQIFQYTKSDFGESGLVELAELNWWELNFPGQKSKIDSRMAANFIMRTAEQRGIFDMEKLRGRGAWIDDDRVVYHHGSHLSVNGEACDVTKIKSRYVYELAKSMQAPADTPLTDDEGQRLIEVMKMFRWSIGGSALLFAGWIALAPVCGAIPWRPHIWMTGGAGSGKSSLAKFAHALLRGTDVFAQGNSTEAGIRQRLRADARPVIMDESESNEESDAKRVQSILGLIRQASTESDAETLKGTTDGSGMTYHIRSMFCLASIQVALKHKADIDRLTVLTLRSGRASDPGAGSEWGRIKDAMYQLTDKDPTVRGRLLRRCIDLLPVTMKNIEVFSRVGADFFGSQRDGDQYGALLAGAWSLMSQEIATPAQALAMFEGHKWEELRDNADADESQRALSALMGALVRIKGGIELTVYELVRAACRVETGITEITDVTADAILQRHGMKVKGDYLVLANDSNELRRLMDGTTFEADYRGVLLRVEGADKNTNKTERFNGVQTKCIRIPVGPLIKSDRQEAAF